MNKYHQHRASVLRGVSLFPKSGKRLKGIIRQDDYIAAPPPINLSAHPFGDCLVWLYALTEEGYGRATFPEREQLAHRQAFKQSRGNKTDADVLHLCHRRFCIQPSHLYSGDAQENADDRRLYRDDGLDLRLHFRKAEIVQSVANYRWPSPAIQQAALGDLTIIPVGHNCEYVIPAGSMRICPICEQPEDGRFREQEQERQLQPPDSSRIRHRMVTTKRSYGDFNDGTVLRLDSHSTIEVAKNRAEKRRMERARENAPSEPVLLHQKVLNFSESPSQSVYLDNASKVYGPALIVNVVTPLRSKRKSASVDICPHVLRMAQQRWIGHPPIRIPKIAG